MPKYLCTFDYSAVGTQGLLKDGGSKREKVVSDAVKAAGGTARGLLLCVRCLRRGPDRRHAGQRLGRGYESRGWSNRRWKSENDGPAHAEGDRRGRRRAKVSYRAPGA